jgi:hypothetical protein
LQISQEREQWGYPPLKYAFFIFFSFLIFQSRVMILLDGNVNGEDPISLTQGHEISRVEVLWSNNQFTRFFKNQYLDIKRK